MLNIYDRLSLVSSQFICCGRSKTDLLIAHAISNNTCNAKSTKKLDKSCHLTVQVF